MHTGVPNRCSKLSLISGSKPEPKPLFRRILHVSPCGSIFWRDRDPSRSNKSFEINLLEECGGKKVGNHFTQRSHAGSTALAGQAPSSALALLGTRALPDNFQAAPHSIHGPSPTASATCDLRGGSRSVAKSLFQRILPVSPCSSRFWQDRTGSLPHKPLEINILEGRAEKMRGLSTARESCATKLKAKS
jgi:hypothetical protein